MSSLYCGYTEKSRKSDYRKSLFSLVRSNIFFLGIVLDYLRRRQCRTLAERLPDRFPSTLPELVSRSDDYRGFRLSLNAV